MAESDTGLIVDCRTCKRVMWAGFHPDCSECRAGRECRVQLGESDPEKNRKEHAKGPEKNPQE